MIGLISLEAPASSLLEQLIDDNACRISRLFNGRKGKVLDLAPPFLDGSVYATLYTGQYLSGHGIYSLFTWSASEQRLRLSYDLIPDDTLFRRLDRAGKRVLAIDPPEHPLQELTNGIVVSGCQFRSRVHLANWSRPHSVSRDLSKYLGKTPRGEETFGQPSQRHLLHLRKILIQAPARLDRAVEHLLDRKATDVLWIHMAAVHLAGHQFWDPASIDLIGRSSTGGNLLKDSLIDVYLATDSALGRIMSILPDTADLIVFWAKGMGPETCRSDLLPEMLTRILNPGSSSIKTSGNDTLTKLRAILPTSLRTKVADALPDWLSLQDDRSTGDNRKRLGNGQGLFAPLRRPRSHSSQHPWTGA